jgi:hypothetical protein
MADEQPKTIVDVGAGLRHLPGTPSLVITADAQGRYVESLENLGVEVRSV